MSGAEKAGEVARKIYEMAVEDGIHPEDALDVARDAGMHYLEEIGATRAAPLGDYESAYVQNVKVTNVEEIAEAVARFGGSNS